MWSDLSPKLSLIVDLCRTENSGVKNMSVVPHGTIGVRTFVKFPDVL